MASASSVGLDLVGLGVGHLGHGSNLGSRGRVGSSYEVPRSRR